MGDTLEEYLAAVNKNQPPAEPPQEQKPPEKSFFYEQIKPNLDYISTGGVQGKSPSIGSSIANETVARVLGGGMGALREWFRPSSGSVLGDVLETPDRLLMGPLSGFTREVAGKDATRLGNDFADYIQQGMKNGTAQDMNTIRKMVGGKEVPVAENSTYESTFPEMANQKGAGDIFRRIVYNAYTDPVRSLMWALLPTKTKSLAALGKEAQAASAARAPLANTRELVEYAKNYESPIQYKPKPSDYMQLQRRRIEVPEQNPVASRVSGEEYQLARRPWVQEEPNWRSGEAQFYPQPEGWQNVSGDLPMNRNYNPYGQLNPRAIPNTGQLPPAPSFSGRPRPPIDMEQILADSREMGENAIKQTRPWVGPERFPLGEGTAIEPAQTLAEQRYAGGMYDMPPIGADNPVNSFANKRVGDILDALGFPKYGSETLTPVQKEIVNALLDMYLGR